MNPPPMYSPPDQPQKYSPPPSQPPSPPMPNQLMNQQLDRAQQQGRDIANQQYQQAVSALKQHTASSLNKIMEAPREEYLQQRSDITAQHHNQEAALKIQYQQPPHTHHGFLDGMGSVMLIFMAFICIAMAAGSIWITKSGTSRRSAAMLLSVFMVGVASMLSYKAYKLM